MDTDPELLSALSEEVKCSVCLDFFSDPRILEACSHVFCYQCLLEMTRSNRNSRSIECPVCRKLNPLPSSGVNGLKKNLYLKNISDKLRAYATPARPNRTNASSSSAQDAGYTVRPSAPPMNEAPLPNYPVITPLDYADSPDPPLRTSVEYDRPELDVSSNSDNSEPEAAPSSFLGSLSSFVGRLLSPAAQEPLPAPNNLAVSYVSFKISDVDVRVHFNSWQESLWFTPSDFSGRLTFGPVERFYLPFWVFDVVATTVYTAKVLNGFGGQTGEFVTTNGTLNHTYKDFMVYAADPSYDREFKALVESFTWDSSDCDLGRAALSPGVQPLPNREARVIWDESGEPNLRRIERARCHSEIRSGDTFTILAPVVKDIVLSMQTQVHRQKLVFFPIHVGTYNYEDSRYKFVCNGCTGEIQGDRPIGLGTLGKIGRAGFKYLTGAE